MERENPTKAENRPRSLRFILHGQRSEWPELRETIEELRKGGFDIEVRLTWEGGDGRRFAAEAARNGVSTVVALGGDGTLHEVANGLCDAGVGEENGPKTSFGFLPGGTANDFATAAGFRKGNLQANLEPVLRDERHAIDLVRVRIDEAEPRRLLNIATAGIGAEATSEAAPATKRILGNLAYLISGLSHVNELEAEAVEVEGDGFSWSGPAFGVAVGNGIMAGGGAQICPDARIDDGLVDVVICPEMPLRELLPVVGDTFRHADFRHDSRIEYHQLSEVTLRFEDEFPVNLDGERQRGRVFEFVVEPGRLEAHLPASGLLV